MPTFGLYQSFFGHIISRINLSLVKSFLRDWTTYILNPSVFAFTWKKNNDKAFFGHFSKDLFGNMPKQIWGLAIWWEPAKASQCTFWLFNRLTVGGLVRKTHKKDALALTKVTKVKLKNEVFFFTGVCVSLRVATHMRSGKWFQGICYFSFAWKIFFFPPPFTFPENSLLYEKVYFPTGTYEKIITSSQYPNFIQSITTSLIFEPIMF